MPPDTNRGPTVPGDWVRLGGRKLSRPICRDEVAAALVELRVRTGQQEFTVREVYNQMLLTGTVYAESTVFKTIQRMKAPPLRPPFLRLERAAGDAFRLAVADVTPAEGSPSGAKAPQRCVVP
jgi:hypothetical protein